MLTVRRVRFAWPEAIDSDWIPAHPEFAYAANGVSLLMPYAEPLFIDAVREAAQALPPKDAARLAAYTGQETTHWREHERLNSLLRRRHPSLSRVERWADACARWVRRRSTAFKVAFAAGGEVMSFLLARWVDRNAPRVFRGADPMVASIFLWHLAEEVEHKSAAADVFEAVDGSRVRYAVAMVTGSSMLFFLVWIAMLIQLRDAGRLLSPLAHLRILRWALDLGFTLLPGMFVSALPGHGPRTFADPPLLSTWLRSYDPVSRTMPLWERDGRTA
ncbi:MAG: hypothetical protein KatS3mg008_1256 [Acidimicrobiales bacterium]|nr:MAG: hypothetical protein KatS3mg008_1256 [Acidimicrobiales bacterium]